jgi:ubiquinone/menaquinone biosynthesis C-methylase UbiE
MTGVDISERMIALAEEEERHRPLGIRYVCTPYTRLGAFAARSFDAVVSFMAIMDGPGLGAGMAEAFRVLLAFSITHPCFITRGARWVRDEQGAKIAWMVSNYFNAVPWVERWRFTDASTDAPEFTVPRFDRTLSTTSTRSWMRAFASRASRSPARQRNIVRPIQVNVAAGTTPGCSFT